MGSPPSVGGPSRLIEVCGGNKTIIRLRQADDIPPRSQYLTLSHCWGDSLKCKLLTRNIDVYSRAIPNDHLNATFSDAIHLVSRLGFRYIWIDALCFIQDCEKDWIRESAKMGDIYSCGILNIAASAAIDGRGGLFQKVGNGTTCIIRFADGTSQSMCYMTYGLRDYDKLSNDTKLNSRAWVMQERLLSPATVHFTKDQALWECHQLTAAEWLPDRCCPRADQIELASHRSVIQE